MYSVFLSPWRHLIVSFARLMDLFGQLYRQRLAVSVSAAMPQTENLDPLFSAGLMVREAWVEVGTELKKALNSAANGR